MRLPVEKYTKSGECSKNISHYKSNRSFFTEVRDILCADTKYKDSMLFRQESDQGRHPVDMHNIAYQFAKRGIRATPEEFIAFSKTQYTDGIIADVAKKTTTQSICSLWKDCRFGRMTASIINDVHACSTIGQQLIIQRKIFGASEVFQTLAMTNGLDMEDPVRMQFAIDNNVKVNMGFLQLSREHPQFAASPDGVGENFIIEIKTPMCNENKKNFVNQNGRPAKKVLLQMLLQMHLCKKPYGYLLVTDDTFTHSRKYDVVKVCMNLGAVDPDEQLESERNFALLQDAMKIGEEFWAKNIFPLLLRPMRPLIH